MEECTLIGNQWKAHPFVFSEICVLRKSYKLADHDSKYILRNSQSKHKKLGVLLGAHRQGYRLTTLYLGNG